MTKHLTSEQLSSVLAGGATDEEIRHTQNCLECAAKIHEFNETLSIFRGAVQHWSTEKSASSFRQAGTLRPSRALTIPRFAWGMAVAMFFLLVALPVYKNLNNTHREIGPDDALLLEQVNAHLSQTVPLAMEPLMDLISDGSTDEVGGPK